MLTKLDELISRSDNCPEFTKLAGRKRKVLECPTPEEFTKGMNELSEDSIMSLQRKYSPVIKCCSKIQTWD